MTLSDTEKMLACKLAWQTADAYSADIFGQVMWTQAAQMLLDMGFTSHQVRAVLRSKLTRWCRDAYGEESTWLGMLCQHAYAKRDAIIAGEYGDGRVMEGCPQ